MEGFDFSGLIDQGVVGLLLLWFMLRLERFLRRTARQMDLMARSLLRLLEREDPHLASELSKDLYRSNGDVDGD